MKFGIWKTTHRVKAGKNCGLQQQSSPQNNKSRKWLLSHGQIRMQMEMHMSEPFQKVKKPHTPYRDFDCFRLLAHACQMDPRWVCHSGVHIWSLSRCPRVSGLNSSAQPHRPRNAPSWFTRSLPSSPGSAAGSLTSYPSDARMSPGCAAASPLGT